MDALELKDTQLYIRTIIDKLWKAGLLLKNHRKYPAVYHPLPQILKTHFTKGGETKFGECKGFLQCLGFSCNAS